ncbi:hypothetical protein NMY22_g13152 [Coprinellus aureogranulatus]|nr:hypothetical protein NMY22_g13152 [Coprinellus aureogranulatus]
MKQPLLMRLSPERPPRCQRLSAPEPWNTERLLSFPPPNSSLFTVTAIPPPMSLIIGSSSFRGHCLGKPLSKAPLSSVNEETLRSTGVQPSVSLRPPSRSCLPPPHRLPTAERYGQSDVPPLLAPPTTLNPIVPAFAFAKSRSRLHRATGNAGTRSREARPWVRLRPVIPPKTLCSSVEANGEAISEGGPGWFDVAKLSSLLDYPFSVLSASTFANASASSSDIPCSSFLHTAGSFFPSLVPTLASFGSPNELHTDSRFREPLGPTFLSIYIDRSCNSGRLFTIAFHVCLPDLLIPCPIYVSLYPISALPLLLLPKLLPFALFPGPSFRIFPPYPPLPLGLGYGLGR